MKCVKTFEGRVYYKNMTQTFNASSSFQTFSVPASTTSLTVDCVASKGLDAKTNGGKGGRVQCVLPVVSSSTLYLYVGPVPTSAVYTAEYNASDIRTDNTGILDSTSLSSRLVVAGGGGNSCIASGNYAGIPGDGGGTTGGDSLFNGSSDNNSCGKGGTQTAGGAAGQGASAGAFGLGGAGREYNSTDKGGAGGAGWYGGGGGGATRPLSVGGAGGSSYTDSVCSSVTHTQGYNNGAGYITLSYTVVSTSSDYDYYVDNYSYKLVKDTSNNIDTYYGVDV